MTNSAILLLDVLQEGRNIRKDMGSVDAWKQLLRVESPLSLLGALGEFLSLADRASREVLAVHDDVDGVNYWRTRIFNGFHSTSLGQPWGGFRAQIDDIAVFTLRSHGKILEMNKPLKGLSSEEIATAGEFFQEALAVIIDSSIDVNVRQLLITRIEQIKSLLNRYQFIGPDAMTDAAKILAAELALVPKEEAEAVKESGAYEKIRSGLEILANASQVTSTSLPVIAATGTYILKLLS